METKLNIKAAELKSKLFALVADFKSLQAAVESSHGSDAAVEAAIQIDFAACGLARVYDSLGDLFMDAHRDKKDQSYACLEMHGIKTGK